MDLKYIKRKAIFRVWAFADEFSNLYEDENGTYFSDEVDATIDEENWTEDEGEQYRKFIGIESDILWRKMQKYNPVT